MTRKEQFVRDLQQMATLLARNVDHCRSLVKQFFSEGYASGGTDPLTDTELDAMQLDLELADVGAGIGLAEQLIHFNDAEAVAQDDYASTMAKLRTGLS